MAMTMTSALAASVEIISLIGSLDASEPIFHIVGLVFHCGRDSLAIAPVAQRARSEAGRSSYKESTCRFLSTAVLANMFDRLNPMALKLARSCYANVASVCQSGDKWDARQAPPICGR